MTYDVTEFTSIMQETYNLFDEKFECYEIREVFIDLSKFFQGVQHPCPPFKLRQNIIAFNFVTVYNIEQYKLIE